jgi:hypothetical protein
LEDTEEFIQAMHKTITNEMEKTKLATSNNQDHSMLNYLLESTPSKLKNNFMLLDP